jgi:hypothetical protein
LGDKNQAKTKRTGPENRADALGEASLVIWLPVF